ncbi:SDR family oxidoreductase [Alistipes sp. ZOR0009]|uniref:SDR family oxidoreductase n=1 Tax=Alistipes sp. ZOR0009 TaxID=1339253 RepID=UPI00064887C6|nr:SDR family oxidoreductase [Alistipes sp. ZOR0009]
MKNKIIIITGGMGLIGKEIVNNIKRKGGLPIIVDINVDTNLENGIINIDITNDNDINKGIDAIIDHFGRIDGLVNNAYPRTSDWGNRFELIEPNSWRKNIDMQLNSYFVISQKVLKQMALQGFGSIVNIASIYGVVGNDFTLYEEYGGTSPAAYSAIKGGLINFTRYLASYYGRKGIRVNSVSPGGIFDNQHHSFVSRYEAKVPMGRLGRPDDIAPAVSFLLSDEAKYITGQNLIVDGGWTCI